MSNLTTLPLEDGFKTSLSQSWDGATGTVYVASTPNFTFPSGVTTYIVVNPGKSNMQIAEINAYNSSTKTLTVNNITLEKGASINSTAQTHNVGSEVIISDNYQFWKDIQTAINSKANLDTDNVHTAGKTTYTSTSEAQDVAQNVTTAQRDALTGVVNGTRIYNTTLGQTQWYEGGTWISNAAGGSVANASPTVAGKIEIATSAESIAGTDTGGTGASLSVLPSDIAANTQSGTFVYAADAEASDTYVISLTPALTAYTTGQTISFSPNTTNTGACTINIDGLGAIDIKTKSGSNPPNGYLVSGRIYDLKYDGTNFIIQEYSSTFGGDSSDGVQGDSDLTITGSNNTYIVKNFSSWTAGSVARTCTVTPTNCVVHIKINGDADFTNWTFDFSGKGGQGSTGTRRSDNTEGGKGYGIVTCDGGTGDYPSAVNGSFVAHDGYGASGAQGHGQSFILDSTSASTASPRFGISRSPQIHPEFIKASKSIIVCCGGGGSGGISLSTVGGENGGNGGHGGGCIIIEVTGNITFSSTTINVNGTAGTTANGATGGGGGGGSIVVIYGGTVTGSPTTDVTGADTGDRAGGVGVYALISNDLLF